MNALNERKVAVLMTEGFEEVEYTEPRKVLEQEGATVEVVAPKGGSIRAWAKTDWGKEYQVDKTLEEARASDYDALLLPGGVWNPDRLRTEKKAVEFVKAFFQSGKPIAAICHGPWTLIETGEVEGRTVTSYRSVKTDLENAGAKWVDQEVVVDQGLVTSRGPGDLSAFNRKMVEEFREGVHEAQRSM